MQLREKGAHIPVKVKGAEKAAVLVKEIGAIKEKPLTQHWDCRKGGLRERDYHLSRLWFLKIQIHLKGEGLN